MLGAHEDLGRAASAFFGRKREIAELETLLDTSRLVTVAGPGGIGKTRVALELARRRKERGGSVVFAELTAIGDDELVPAAVASSMSLEVPSHQEPADALVAALADQPALVVLDNCEQVVAGVAPLAAHLIKLCPNLHLLATSRESLSVPGEFVYRLDALDEASAIELFLAHARRADPRFEASEHSRDVVAGICTRLDRIALAMELAAARLRNTSLDGLLLQLDERFNVLLGAWNPEGPRHQTMQACLDWSYDLLDPHERAVFRRLGVLSGGFTPEAASHVGAGSDIEPHEVLREIGLLHDKSMLVPWMGGSGRQRMLETIREYALMRLWEEGETETARRAHAEYFAARSAQLAASFGLESEETWVDRYAADVDNFRAALDWATEADTVLAARIVAHLAEFWECNAQVAEGVHRSTAVLAEYEARVGEPDAALLVAAGTCAFSARDYRRSLDLATRAINVAVAAGDLADAKHLAGASRCLLGIDSDRSLAELNEALEHYRTQENPFYTVRAQQNYGYVLARHDPFEGRRLLLESLAQSPHWPRLGVRIEIRLAELEFRAGNAAQAIEHSRSVEGSLRSKRAPLPLAHVLVNLGSYLAVAGHYDAAYEAAREAATLARTHQIPQWVAIALQTLALVHAGSSDPRVAAQLLGYVDAFYSRFGMKREPTEALVLSRLMELLHDQLDEPSLVRETSSGRTLPEANACALAFARHKP